MKHSVMMPSGLPDATPSSSGLMTAAMVNALAGAQNAGDVAAAIAAIADASPSAPRGLVTNAAQILGGVKTLQDGAISPALWNVGAALALYSNQGASSGNVAVRVGSTLASPHAQGELLRVAFGIGGTEAPRFRVLPGTGTSHVAQITAPVVSNAYHLLLDGGSAGWNGVHIMNPASGAGRLAFGGYGDRMGLHVENGGLTFTQNANAYDATRLMRWMVGSATSVAAGVPVFDFQAPANVQAGQRVMLVQVGGVHKFGVTSVGPTVEPGVPFELNGHGGGVRAIFTGGIAGFMNAAGSSYIGFFPGTGRATASHGMLFGGDLESSLTGAGLILKSPDGTKYKLTIANGGTVTTTAV